MTQNNKLLKRNLRNSTCIGRMGSGILKSLKMEVELRFLIITYNKILKPIITQNKQITCTLILARLKGQT